MLTIRVSVGRNYTGILYNKYKFEFEFIILLKENLYFCFVYFWEIYNHVLSKLIIQWKKYEAHSKVQVKKNI